MNNKIVLITPYLPIILTIFGWYVVSRQHNRRERRKEIRELIKLIETKADAILAMATEYYSIDGKNKKCSELETKIRYHFDAIKSLEERVKHAGLPVNVVDKRRDFKLSVTSGEFESRTRTKMSENSNIIPEMATNAVTLIDEFEKAYFKSFPVRFGWNPFSKN